jgi:hypothetical protein
MYLAVVAGVSFIGWSACVYALGHGAGVEAERERVRRVRQMLARSGQR